MSSLKLRDILLAWLWVVAVAGTECEGDYSCLLDNNLVDQFSRTETLTDCHLLCLETAECEVYSLNSALSVCTLLSSCESPDFSCSHCVTGTRQCSPLSLVELQHDSALIGRELQSVAGASNLIP